MPVKGQLQAMRRLHDGKEVEDGGLACQQPMHSCSVVTSAPAHGRS